MGNEYLVKMPSYDGIIKALRDECAILDAHDGEDSAGTRFRLKSMADQIEAAKNAHNPVVFSPTSIKGTWGIVRCGLWQSEVVFFIGSRKEMAHDARLVLESFLDTDASCQGLSHKWAIDAAEYISVWVSQNGDDSNTNGDAFGYIGTSFIRLDDFILGNVDDVAVLSHECLHVANAILRNVGLREDENIEGLCYTHEYIFSRILKRLVYSVNDKKRGIIEK